jgi:hypothetical protein
MAVPSSDKKQDHFVASIRLIVGIHVDPNDPSNA